jgi:putative ABC transport system substrate-binding protein
MLHGPAVGIGQVRPCRLLTDHPQLYTLQDRPWVGRNQMQFDHLNRREVITLISGAAVAWPLPARAQEIERVRRIGIIFPAVADDPVFQAWLGTFLQALALLGWTIGRNVRIDIRWATANPAEIRQGTSELLAFAPDVIVAYGS